jgi:serine/threonine protein phosphatase 1
MGDIHGSYRALRQCLQRAAFNEEVDTLICLGDVCDGWPETNECVQLLSELKNVIFILGNHDQLALQWMTTKKINPHWFEKGGDATIKSYLGEVPLHHIRFLEQAKPFHLEDNRLFVHAGINLTKPLSEQGPDTFLWDRNLARIALNLYEKQIKGKLSPYDEIFIGHTPIPFEKPVRSCEVWLMDTGAGWSGRLSMMDIDTKEIFTSDTVPSLYPGVKGRN